MTDLSQSEKGSVSRKSSARSSWMAVAGLLWGGFLLIGLKSFWALSPAVLVGLPFVVLTVALPGPRPRGLFWAAMVVVVLMAWARPDGLWYIERGWGVILAGWFVAISWRWPDAGLTGRALGAVGSTVAAFGLYFWTQPATWARVDWMATKKVGGDLAVVYETAGQTWNLDADRVEALYRMLDYHVAVYPAMLGLASFAALCAAWWLYIKLSHGRSDGLGPLRDFEFHDGLVWLVVAGLGLVLLGGAWSRVGANALVFTGALYALRGVAVLVAIKGSVTTLTAVLLGILVFLYVPVVIGLAIVIGLSDTWLGLRQRAREALDRSP